MWSDYGFKGGNHSATKHYSNSEPKIFKDVLFNL